MPNSRRLTSISIILALVVVSLLGCATTGQRSGADVAPDNASIEEKWGVKVLGISLTADGYMLDFRYRVLDPEKAKPLFDRQSKPYLIDEATGAMFVVPEPPKVGALRTTRPPKADRNYFIIFANPGRYLKKGHKVSVVNGDFKAEHLVVE
jgi:hypothetical protein